jgi:hypothetical protein
MPDHGDSFTDRLKSFRQSSVKHVFLLRNELELIASSLQTQPTGSGATTRRGRAARRGGGVAAAEACSAHLTPKYIAKNFCLSGDGSSARVCRLVKSGGKVCAHPVVALEDLECMFAEHHQALGHPGFETLYLHVSPGKDGGKSWL